MSQDASLLNIFKVFTKIGGFTIGGGYAMIPIIEHETTSRGWLTEEEFPDIIALAQSVPGLIATNMAIFAGYRIRGIKGSVAATIGTIIAPFTMILLIAMLFTSFKDNPTVNSIFQGIRPAVIALILVPMVRLAKKSNKSWWAWLLCVGALVAVAFLKISPIYILLTVIICSTALAWYHERRCGK